MNNKPTHVVRDDHGVIESGSKEKMEEKASELNKLHENTDGALDVVKVKTILNG